MAVRTLKGNELTAEVEQLISVCKSSSGVCGSGLRGAHHRAGEIIGAIFAQEQGQAQRVAVIIMMRAGLPFGLGIADALEAAGRSVSVFFSTKETPVPGSLDPSRYDRILLADAVIRTGRDMLAAAEKLGSPDKFAFAANVLDESGAQYFEGKTLYAFRVSKNSFVGSGQKHMADGKGPDTGDRLFQSDF